MNKNIAELEHINDERTKGTTFFGNRNKAKLSLGNDIVVVGGYTQFRFKRFVKAAILEQEQSILDRAYQLEEEDYKETLRLAKREAASLLVGEDLTVKED